MKKPAKEPRSDRVVSIALSVLVHAAIVGALLWGWWQYRTPKSVPDTLAIQATVVQNAPQRVHAAPPTPTPPAPTPPAPTPPPPAPQPQPKVDQVREREQAQAAQQAAELAAQQHAAAQKAAEHAAAVKAAAAKAEAERQAREEAQREAELAAERKAKEEAEAKAQAELKAKQDAAREAQVVAQQLKAERDEQQRAADLQQQVQAEEHLEALESSPEKAEYLSLIQARISRAWIRPASAQPGVKCIVHLTQIPGGEITHVAVEGCNGDEAVRQSVQTAAYRASPLPAPPDPALFDPNITVTFAPDQ